MKATRITEQVCPYCKAHHDAATMATGNKKGGPSPQGFTICFACGEICQFNDELQMCHPDPTELEDMERRQPEDYLLMLTAQALIKFRAGGAKDDVGYV